MTARRDRNAERELTRDEVYVPELHRYPTEWERDNALAGYRVIKRSGWLGKLALALAMVAVVVGLLSYVVAMPEWLGAVCALGAGLVGFAAAVLVAFRSGRSLPPVRSNKRSAHRARGRISR